MSDPQSNSPQIRELLVIGGGLAGLSCAVALSGAGFIVHVLERRPYIGGRASSYKHPGTGETIDNSQHALLGCFTNLVDFYQRLGVAGKINWTNRITFIEPGGRRSTLKPGPLPAPMHSGPSFLSAPMLSIADKVGISNALRKLVHGPLDEETRTFGDWLRDEEQTPVAIEHFWRPILVSALNDEPDNVSIKYGTHLFYESLLKSPQAGSMGVSTVPLTELYQRAITLLQDRGSALHLRTPVEFLKYDDSRRRWRAETMVESFEGDAVVFAVPFQAMRKFVANVSAAAQSSAIQQFAQKLDQFQTAPITGIHLWLDRVITDLPLAALLDSPLQWIFQKSRLQPETRASVQGSYVELVVSHSVEMVNMSRQQLLDLALSELPRFFPAMYGANVLKSVVVKEVNATFRVPAGIDQFRPSQIGPWKNSFLAGDWTATNWPSTMESAVRSGYLAAEAVCTAAGKSAQFLQPDLPATGIMRLLSRNRARS